MALTPLVRRGGRVGRVAAAFPLSVIVLAAVSAVAPRRSGARALAQLFEPHLFAGLVALLPVAIATRSRSLAGALAAAGAVAAGRYAPRPRLSRRSRRSRKDQADEAPAATALTVATWNLLADGRPAAPLCAALRALGADVIAIQELQTHVAAAIDGDPVLAFRYPHRWLAARGDIQGMGLLSRWPLLRRERQLHPPTLRATVDLGGPGLVTIVTTHPVPPRIRALGLLPVGYEPAARDHALRRATALLDEAIERGERMILAGDLNLTDREPAYRRLPAALVDAQRAAGTWPGSTWRPRSMLALPFGLLRIDHVFAGPGATPLRTRVVRSAAGSDHFPVVATFRLDGRGAAAARRQRR